MKRATLILAAAIGMLLGTSQLALADDYTGNCTDVSSWDGSGNANISDDTGNCTISNDVSATGYISIIGSGTINTQALSSSGGSIVVESQSGTVTIGGDITTNAWTVIVSSPSDISLQNVYTSGTGYHDVRILAHNAGSGSSQFVIGSAGAANGVGTIDASNSDGYDNIYISNGASGGISYSGTGILDVSASGGQAGRITLDTEDGTGNIVLNGGTIVADGSGYPAGDINLVTSASGAIVVSSNTTLSVQGSGPYPFIDLSSDTITLNANLTVTMSGGNIANNGEIGGITPNGSASIVAPTDPTQGIYFTPWTESNNNLSITGTGTLAWTATGDYTGLSFAGNNLIITANTVIHNTGNGVSTYLSSNDSSFNAQPITIGKVQLYANSSTTGDTAGTVTLGASQLTSITGPVVLDASGGGSGDGGTVYFFPGNGTVPFGASGGNYFHANVNGGPTGGNAGTFETWGNGNSPYLVSFQAADGITASAQSADGNGGTISIDSDSLNFALSNASLHADAVGAGNGGAINISNSTMTFTGTTSSISANGAGTMNGGTPANGINISTNSDLTVGSGTGGDVSLSANGLASSSNGGNIVITANNITVKGNISATAGSNGDGGTISLTGDQYSGTIEVDSTLDVSAGTTQGQGGNVTISAGTINLPNIAVSANGVGTGDAGTISLNSPAFNTMNLTGATFSASGDTGGSGKGKSVLITNGGPITVDNATFKANGGGSDGDAGMISLTIDPNTTAITVTTAKFQATAHASGKGGNVQISQAAGTLTPTDPNVGINVPYIINVDGGGSLGTSDLDGSVSLNGVTCQQWKTIAATYPKTGWDCITPTTGANIGTLVSAGASFSSTIQLDLAVLVSPPPADQTVGVYAMHSVDSFRSFFGQSPVNEKDYGISNLSYLRVSGTFQYVDTAQGEVLATTDSGSSTIMVAALVHELGHHLDYIWGPSQSTLSQQNAWTSLGAPDFAHMNSEACNAVFLQATCNTYSPSKTNSQIFAIQFPGIGTPAERFAAMFEHVESLLTGNPVSYEVNPELEKALEAFPQQKQYMMNTIASPPSPVN